MQSIILPPTNQQNSRAPLGQKNKNKNKKRKNRRPRASRRKGAVVVANGNLRTAAVRRASFFRLSPCSTLYLRALLDPFSLEGGHACVPDLNDVPSFKFLSISRGTLETGTGGLGYILMLLSPSNSTNTVLVTANNFASTTVQPLGTTGTTGLGQTGQPFPAASFSSIGYSWRAVGAGLRIRYLGTELNRSGRVVPYRQQGFPADLTGMAAASFLARPEIPSMAVTRDWHHIVWQPFNSQAAIDYDYKTSNIDYVVAGAADADLGFWIDGTQPGAPFEFEIYSHYEVAAARGGLSPAGISPSHSDVPGISAIRNTLENTMPGGTAPGTPESNFNRVWNAIKNFAPQDMSSVVSGLETARKVGGPLLLEYSKIRSGL